MMRMGKPLEPLNMDIECLPTAQGSSSKLFDKEYAEAED